MRVVGVIAEYNPLHNGHVYHLEQARRLSHADSCIVAMSGNFVQRGEPACADKFLRAEWAVRAGADLVLELPTVYAVSSAERFALGGVRTLLATGVVTDLAFGCEAGDIGPLTELSELFSNEPERFQQALRKHLSSGKSYPRARYDALSDYGAPETLLEALTKPNNILAIEYLRALRAIAPGIRPLPIPRIGSDYHEDTLTGAYASATALRLALKNRNPAALSAMPMFAGGTLFYGEQYPIDEDALGPLMLYALRGMSVKSLSALPDIGEGFENVLAKAVRKSAAIGDFYAEVKSKRYTLARCKRIAVSALLGITAAQVHEIVRTEGSEYLKALAFQGKSRQLLSEIGKRTHAPLILRQSDTADCPPVIQRSIATDAFSTDVLAFASKTDVRRDYRGPVVV